MGIAKLPLNKVGYPIPWFVWFDPETGEPDFRIMRPDGIRRAVTQKLCWVCGEPMFGNAMQAFVIGPMCAVNHTSAEPPSHYLCAKWSAIACPFLATPQMVRRERGMPQHSSVAGVMIARNPGVTLVWKVRPDDWSLFSDGDNGVLFDIGQARGVEWYAHGRDATRTEVEHSIDTGIPILMEMAEEEGPEAVQQLHRLHDAAKMLLPA